MGFHQDVFDWQVAIQLSVQTERLLRVGVGCYS